MTVETVLLFALAAVAVTVLVRWVADRTGLPTLLAPLRSTWHGTEAS